MVIIVFFQVTCHFYIRQSAQARIGELGSLVFVNDFRKRATPLIYLKSEFI